MQEKFIFLQLRFWLLSFKASLFALQRNTEEEKREVAFICPRWQMKG